MSDSQTYVSLSTEELPAKVRELRDQRWRLVQMGVTPVADALEMNYSFDREGRFLNLRLTLPLTGARVPSISDIYWCAFIYENEIHDLFRVQIDGIAVDYHGKFYRTSVPFPFASRGQTLAGVTPTGTITPASPSAAPAAAAPKA